MTICIAVFLLVGGFLKDDTLQRFSLEHPRVYTLIHMLSQITLAVYLVQGFHDRILLRYIMAYVPFPGSYILSIMVVLGFALVFSGVDFSIKRR